MDSVEESLRGLLAHSVPRPGSEPDPGTSAEFGQLLSQAALAGPDAPLDYRLAAPKWQFLCHAADHGAYVLHGSGTDDIAEVRTAPVQRHRGVRQPASGVRRVR